MEGNKVREKFKLRKSHDHYCGFCELQKKEGNVMSCGCENSAYYGQQVVYVNCPCYKPLDALFAGLNYRNPEEAFKNAMERGMREPSEWMYMYSDGCYDYFKHYLSRNYTKYRFVSWFRWCCKQLHFGKRISN